MRIRLDGLPLVGLAVLTLTGGCSGANEVSGPDLARGGTTTTPTPVVAPHPRPTPPECLPLLSPLDGNLVEKNKPCTDDTEP